MKLWTFKSSPTMPIFGIIVLLGCVGIPAGCQSPSSVHNGLDIYTLSGKIYRDVSVLNTNLDWVCIQPRGDTPTFIMADDLSKAEQVKVGYDRGEQIYLIQKRHAEEYARATQDVAAWNQKWRLADETAAAENARLEADSATQKRLAAEKTAADLAKDAGLGNKEAMFRLGCCFATGDGVMQNDIEAVKWYRKAADLGQPAAMCNLGGCYTDGRGVPMDKPGAVKWYRKAADLGDKEAMFKLGCCFANGDGVIQNEGKACFHFIVAGALGQKESAAKADELRIGKLSSAEYDAAKRLAAEWMKKFTNEPSSSDDTMYGEQPQLGITPQLIGSGTCFVLSDDGYFITCAHVVKGGKKLSVLIGGTKYPATLVKMDNGNDVALLKLDGKGFHPVPLRHELPEMGGKVFTVGFPNPDIQGSAAKYTDGAISALTGIQDDVRTIQVTVPVQPGNSGGPLADETGNVVGIVVAKLNAATVFEYTGDIPQNVNFAVKIGYAMPLIQSVSGLSKRLPSARESRKGVNAATELEKGTGMVLVYK